MPGPVSPRQALPWIRQALDGGRYFPLEPHFGRRCEERGLGIDDVKHAIKKATRCESYQGRAPSNDGTNWRVLGPSIDGEPIAVGVEAFMGEDGRSALLITLFEV
jgi:hypothetical protein